MKFRRNTHDRNGNYRGAEYCDTYKCNAAWSAYGDIGHHLCSEKGMTFNELMDEIRKDTTNYFVVPNLGYTDGGELPNYRDVAFGLIRLIEVGLVEVVED